MSGQGTPFGDGCGKGCVGVAALLAFWVAVFCGLVIAMGCMPVADNPPDTVDNRCGETGACEGSATTEHPGCDVPGVAVFDLDGRPICEAQP